MGFITTTIRYGLPLAFVHCTIYQQDIWREGDERLILEQKRAWRDLFSVIDLGYNTVAKQLNVSSENNRLDLATKFDSLSMKDCWNAHVRNTFSNMAKMSASKSFDLSGWTKSFGLTK